MILNGNGNVYEQIVDYYHKYISLGVIKQDDKLPSCREFASELGVNFKTVEKAYQELVSENLIECIPKKGYFVKKVQGGNSKMVHDVLKKLKDDGITKQEIIDAVNEIYKEESK